MAPKASELRRSRGYPELTGVMTPNPSPLSSISSEPATEMCPSERDEVRLMKE